MLIVALVLAVIGLAALVTAVVTSNELIAWVCIAASGLGVLLLIVDAIRDRAHRRAEFPAAVAVATGEITEVIEPVEISEVVEGETAYSAEDFGDEVAEGFPDEVSEDISELVAEDTPEDTPEDIPELIPEDIAEDIAEEDHPDELVYDEPEYDIPSDDEAEFPEPAEEAAIHTVSESYIAQEADDEIAREATGQDATEVRYIESPEDSAPTVVYTYSESAETENVETVNAETENVDTEDSPGSEEHRDR